MRGKPQFSDRLPQLPEASAPLDAQLLTIVDQMPILVWTTDKKLRCTAALGGAGLPAGVKARDLLGKTVRQVMHPEEGTSLAAHRQALKGEPAKYRSEFRGRTFECSIAPLLQAGKKVAGTIGAALDVTERHDAEQRADRNQRLFRALVDRGWEGFVLNDQAGKVRYCNAAALKILGLRKDQLIGKSGLDLVDRRDRDRAAQFRDELRTSAGRTLTIEARTILADGSVHWVEYTATNSLEDPDVGAVVAKFRDITERKQAEQKVKELSERMVRLQQEEERRIARELHDSTSQWLTALILNLAALNESSELPRKLRLRMRQALDLARQTANEIRTASYLLHPPTLEEFGLLTTLEEYVRGFSERSGITIRFRKPRRFPENLGIDLEMTLFRIVQEALSNVHRHSTTEQAELAISIVNSALTIEINDHGKGMRKVLRDSLNRDSGFLGVGVGLNGIRERVRQLNGTFRVSDRRPGTGIRIEIPLPRGLSPESKKPAKLSSKAAKAAAG